MTPPFSRVAADTAQAQEFVRRDDPQPRTRRDLLGKMFGVGRHQPVGPSAHRRHEHWHIIAVADEAPVRGELLAGDPGRALGPEQFKSEAVVVNQPRAFNFIPRQHFQQRPLHFFLDVRRENEPEQFGARQDENRP
jgi:hypothetical protein